MGVSDGVESVPLTVRLVTTPKYLPPVITVRFVGHEISSETVIFPAVLLPIVRVPAVIRPIAVADKPSVVLVSVSFPKLICMPLPIGWMVTLPDVVASTRPARFRLSAVRAIRPPLA